MKVTLLVFILTQGHVTSHFQVDYPNLAKCREGYIQAHKMSIEPKTQEVKAICADPIVTKQFNDAFAPLKDLGR